MFKRKIERSARIPLQIVIEMSNGQQSSLSFCRNLSAGGIFLECTELLPKGTALKIEFTIPITMKKVTLKGRVVWVRKVSRDQPSAGMGVQFEDVSEDLKKDLESAIAYFDSLFEASSA